MFHELLEVGGEMFQQEAVVVLLFHQTNLTFKIKTVEKYQQQAKKYSISPTVGGCGLGGLRSSPPSQGQVHRGAAEVDLDLTRGT